MIFGQDLYFWIAALGAALLKVRLTPWEGPLIAIASVASSVFFAYFGTAPVAHFFNIADLESQYFVAALLALTGEMLARTLVAILSDPNKLREWLATFLGKGGK